MSDKISQNRLYAQRLGWTPTDWGATDFDDLLVAAIMAKQQLWGISADGVAGPRSYERWVAVQLGGRLNDLHAAPDDESRLVAAGKVAAMQALSFWLLNIQDLPAANSPDFSRCQLFIDQTIRTHAGVDWSWERPYRRGSYQWCGAFAARCWAAAGLQLDLRRNYYPSTYRLERYATYQRHNATTPNPRPPQGPYRVCLELDEHSVVADLGSFQPRAGDIVLVGQTQAVAGENFLDYGTHVAVVEHFDPVAGVFYTIEGNGTGLGPDGAQKHGVIRAQRPLGIRGATSKYAYHVRRVIRGAPADIA